MVTASDFKLSSGNRKALIGAGVGAGVALLGVVGRKLAVQAPTVAAGEWDKALAVEHAAALALFDKLEGLGPENGVKRTLLLTHLKNALGKHAFQEENVIYPAMRDAGLKDEADKLTGDHGYVKQYLYDLADLTDDHEGFQAKLHDFRRAIERHMTEEEDVLFVRLKARLDADANKTLTIRMNREGVKLA